jgi:hypothetical protein
VINHSPGLNFYLRALARSQNGHLEVDETLLTQGRRERCFSNQWYRPSFTRRMVAHDFPDASETSLVIGTELKFGHGTVVCVTVPDESIGTYENIPPFGSPTPLKLSYSA